MVPTEEVRKEGERDEPKIKGHQGRDIYPLQSVKYTTVSSLTGDFLLDRIRQRTQLVATLEIINVHGKCVIFSSSL